MYFIFRKNKEKVSASKDVKVNDYFPTIILVALILSLIGVSFLPDTPRTVSGLICLIFALLALIGDNYKNRKENAILESIKNIDFQTLSFLLNLFLIIGGISNIGLIEDFANFIKSIGGSNPFLLYTIIVWGSALISTFIDNIPYVATMLPVIENICASTAINPYLLYFGLLSGATLGGNLTPIGASANVAAVGLLKKEGYKVSFKEFMKYGIPLTLSALVVGYLFIWFVWC
jgi:Na+/H+ antiporter NhaD/arsenite permease-like protein